MKGKEKTTAELKSTVNELTKKKEELEKQLKIAKLKLREMGIKEENLKQLGIWQEISESEQLNKRTKTILSSSHHKTPRNFAVKPIHPGEILREELLIPRNITPEELAQEIKVSKEVVKWVCEERTDITLDLAKRLSIYFDTSVELWLNLQRSYEEELSEASLESLKEEIIPYKEKCINGRHLETN